MDGLFGFVHLSKNASHENVLCLMINAKFLSQSEFVGHRVSDFLWESWFLVKLTQLTVGHWTLGNLQGHLLGAASVFALALFN